MQIITRSVASKGLLPTLCGLLACWANSWAAAQAVTSPPSVVAEVRQAIDASQTILALDEYIEHARQEWGVPGLAVAIVRGDETLLCKGYGVREVGGSATVDEHTLFAIASNTKAFTAAALAMLVDEGRLAWDDHVSQYLPWLRLSDPLATADLRVRDLLCHRSGLGTFSGDLLWWGTAYTPREILERAVQLEPAAAFRAKYGYSNLMFLAAGEVIKVVSGQSWESFIQQRIFQPLHMQRSLCSVRDLVSHDNFATPHKTLRDSSQPLPWMNWDSMVAAGGIISSADDMSRWLQCQLRGGLTAEQKSLFSPAQSREMWEAQTPIPVSESYSTRFPSTHFRAYGLGWSLSDYQGHKFVGHGGGYDGMYSQVAMLPEQKIGVVVLTNSMTSIGSALTRRIVDALAGVPARDWSSEDLVVFRKSREDFDKKIVDTITPVATGTQPSHPLQAFVGDFLCPLYGAARVELDDGHLVLRLLPNPDLVADLQHLHYDTFALRWRQEFAWFAAGTAHFVSDSKGVFDRIELDVPNDDLWFYELKLKRVR